MNRRPTRGTQVKSREPLYKNENEKVVQEARNGLLLFDGVMDLVRSHGPSLALTPDIIKYLQYLSINNIYGCAGHFRDWPVTIIGALHKPPESKYVKGFVEEMCEQANSNEDWSPTKTAAYLLWRLNWIHPFGGGNGRTSRAVSYFALCVRLGQELPGKLTIPEQIVNNRKRYQAALEDADEAWKYNVTDVSKMESLIQEILMRQLSYLDDEGGEAG